MTSLFVERDSALPISHFTLAFNQGSLIDPPGKEGTTSLLLRLLRRSAPGMTAPELDRRLDALGISAGVDISRSAALVQGTCLARSLEQASQLVSDMLCQPPGDEQEFARLKTEALGEWMDSLDNDALVARRFFSRKVFPWHPYSRLTSGTPQSIARIELADLHDAYQKLARGQQLHAAFSGDVTQAGAAQFLERVQGRLSSEAPLPPSDESDPTVPLGRRLCFIDKPQRSQVQILIGGLGAHPKDHDRTALYVGNTIFGGTFSARLSHEVRSKRGWSYGAYSQLGHDRRRHSFSMWTFPQAGDAAACIGLQLTLLEQLIERGVTKSELAAAKKYLLNSHAFALDTASKRAALALDQALYDLPPVETFKERVLGVTLDGVNAALQNRLSPSNLLIVVLGTASELLGPIAGSISDLVAQEVVSFDQQD
jgi:zinc protease